MSDGSDFDRFLQAARADHVSESTTEEAKRVEAALGSRVPLRRPLSAQISAALASMDAAAAASADGPAARSAVSRASARTRWLKALAVAAPMVGLSVVSYSIATRPVPLPGAPFHSSASVEQPAPPPVSADPSTSEEVVEPPAAVVGPHDLPDAKSERPAKLVVSGSGRANNGTLEAELALLGEVTAALQSQKPARALELVEEHGRRFPNGLLAPELAGQRVLTLAALGRRAEACVQSATFLAKYPKSPLAPQVRASCDTTSSR